MKIAQPRIFFRWKFDNPEFFFMKIGQPRIFFSMKIGQPRIFFRWKLDNPDFFSGNYFSHHWSCRSCGSLNDWASGHWAMARFRFDLPFVIWPFKATQALSPGIWKYKTFGPGVLALRASLFPMYWPFGPVCSRCTGPSGQFGSDVLALRASLVPMYWPFGPVYFGCTGPSGQFISNVLALWASLVRMYLPFGPVYFWCTGPSGQFGPGVLFKIFF